MSEYVTHIAVLDDTARFAARSERLPEAFRTALAEHLDYARFGSASRGNHLFVVPLLAKYRTAWAGRKPEDKLAERLAYTLGWVVHRATDTYFKPMHRVLNPDDYFPEGNVGISTARIYNDLVVFRETYDDGRREPLVPGLFSKHLHEHPASEAVDVAAVEPLMQARWQGELMGLHAAAGSDVPLPEKLDALFGVRQDYYVSLDRYADHYASPKPEYEQRFITATGFYDPEDPLIRYTRALQRGEPVEGIDLDRAITTAVVQSRYAQVLARSYHFLHDAGAFFDEEISEAEVVARLELEAGDAARPEALKRSEEQLRRARIDPASDR